jgi:hypothetical protein
MLEVSATPLAIHAAPQAGPTGVVRSGRGFLWFGAVSPPFLSTWRKMRQPRTISYTRICSQSNWALLDLTKFRGRGCGRPRSCRCCSCCCCRSIAPALAEAANSACFATTMNRQTKEVIHDAIARQLSGVFPSIDLEIITEVVDASGGDAGRAAEVLEEMSPPAPRADAAAAEREKQQQMSAPARIVVGDSQRTSGGGGGGGGAGSSTGSRGRRPASKRRVFPRSAPQRQLDPSRSRLTGGDGSDDGSSEAIQRMLVAQAQASAAAAAAAAAARAAAAGHAGSAAGTEAHAAAALGAQTNRLNRLHAAASPPPEPEPELTINPGGAAAAAEPPAPLSPEQQEELEDCEWPQKRIEQLVKANS